jgi:hypothetical protein
MKGEGKSVIIEHTTKTDKTVVDSTADGLNLSTVECRHFCQV